jgi:hypothetical protein
MSRTFSLWSLMVVVTLACMLAALAVNFPLIFWSVVPGFVVAAYVSIFSSQRIATAAIGAGAALAAVMVAAMHLLVRPVGYLGGMPPPWRWFLDQGGPILMASAMGGAFLAGGCSVLFFRRAKMSKDASPTE